MKGNYLKASLRMFWWSAACFRSRSLDSLYSNQMTGYREWDHGKDWNGSGHRGYTRGRDEDEYYSEGKRRKYNNGVRT